MINFKNFIKNHTNIAKIISYVYIIFIIYILLINIFSFKIYYLRNKNIDKYNFLLLLLGIFSIIILYFLSKKISLYIENINLIINSLSILLFIYLILTYKYYYFYNNFDAGGIMLDSVNIATDNHIVYKEYFEKYPNNLFILYLETYIYKFLAFFKINAYFKSILVLINCLIISTSLKIMTKILVLIRVKKEYIVLSLFIFILLIGTSPWIIVFYSDILSMFFILILYYIFLRIKNTEFKLFLILFIFYIGYSIKPHSFFVLLSIVVYYIFQQKEKINLKNIFLSALGLLLSIVFVKIFISTYDLNLDKNKQMTYTHYLMMGHNIKELGTYSSDDVKISVSYSTIKERENKNILEFKNRVKKYGVINLLKLYTKKNLINYNDGAFAFSLFRVENIETDKLYDNLLKKYYYNNGKYNNLFNVIMQSVWLGILFLGLFGERNNAIISMFKFSLLGISIFLMLFESSSRYLFQFVPIFIICAIFGLENLIKFKYKIVNKG